MACHYYLCPEDHFTGSATSRTTCPAYVHGSPCGLPVREVSESGNPLRRKVSADA